MVVGTKRVHFLLVKNRPTLKSCLAYFKDIFTKLILVNVKIMHILVKLRLAWLLAITVLVYCLVLSIVIIDFNKFSAGVKH